MTDLSPAAQAVRDAYDMAVIDAKIFGDADKRIAAALRAAADQFPWDEDFNGMCCCEHLKAIAAELEGAQ